MKRIRNVTDKNWQEFLSDLQQRGLHGIKLLISDDHAGLKAARKAILPGIQWQRCHFHLQQNAQSYVTTHDKKREAGNAILLYHPCHFTSFRMLGALTKLK